ncbi:MAG: hypothetical protein ACJA2S_003595 [Cyclobacteriaceae bacterium]
MADNFKKSLLSLLFTMMFYKICMVRIFLQKLFYFEWNETLS